MRADDRAMRLVARSWWLRITLVLTGVAASARAEDAWRQLKVGMTRSETAAVLGDALLTNRARGFMIQIYDAGAEVVYVHGRVASWTAPAGSGSVAPAFHPWPTVAPIPAAASFPKGRAAASGSLRRPSTLPAYRL